VIKTGFVIYLLKTSQSRSSIFMLILSCFSSLRVSKQAVVVRVLYFLVCMTNCSYRFLLLLLFRGIG
jgi:hypothetical protein